MISGKWAEVIMKGGPSVFGAPLFIKMKGEHTPLPVVPVLLTSGAL